MQEKQKNDQRTREAVWGAETPKLRQGKVMNTFNIAER